MAPHDSLSAHQVAAAGPNALPNPEVGKLAHRLLLSAGRGAGEFDDDRWTLIGEVLAFAAEAEQRITEQQERIHHLESLSMTDELTGLANRRSLGRFLDRAIASAQRHGDFGVVGYFDLDGFKVINDDFGHAAGDASLRHVAGILNSGIRAGDLAARIGGDEFAVVFERADWGLGARRLVAIQEIINATPVGIAGGRLPVGVSMGLAPFGPSTSSKQVLGQADAAMYADKRARILKSSADPAPEQITEKVAI